MKTIEEKAAIFLMDHNAFFGDKEDVDGMDLHNSLVKLLKEQDRDTRHACAEAMHDVEKYWGNYIYSDAAYNAIMNTKAE